LSWSAAATRSAAGAWRRAASRSPASVCSAGERILAAPELAVERRRVPATGEAGDHGRLGGRPPLVADRPVVGRPVHGLLALGPGDQCRAELRPARLLGVEVPLGHRAGRQPSRVAPGLGLDGRQRLVARRLDPLVGVAAPVDVHDGLDDGPTEEVHDALGRPDREHGHGEQHHGADRKEQGPPGGHGTAPATSGTVSA
jgi:hypothetical protein